MDTAPSEERGTNPSLTNFKHRLKTELLQYEAFTHGTLDQAMSGHHPNVLHPNMLHVGTYGQLGFTLEETVLLTWDEPLNANELHRLIQSHQLGSGPPIEEPSRSSSSVLAKRQLAVMELFGGSQTCLML